LVAGRISASFGAASGVRTRPSLELHRNDDLLKPKFSLKGLLLFIMLAAVSCWWYVVGWPAWQEHRVSCLTRSIHTVTALELHPQKGKRFQVSSSGGRIAITGGIELHVGDYTLLSDRAVIWRVLPTDTSDPVEAYLEGNVQVRGNGPTGALAAVYVNAADGKFALLRNGTFAPKDLVKRAEELRQRAVQPTD
jgi:hypothetical protein